MKKKHEQKVKTGISRKDISEARKRFYKESLEPKFNRIDKRVDQTPQRFNPVDQRLERVKKIGRASR